MKANLITLKMGKHAARSGYDRLADYVRCNRITPPSQWSLGQRVTARLMRPVIKGSGSQWYHREHLIAEMSAARKWCGQDGQIFHYLYGENSYRYLGLLKSRCKDNRIVCTYHTPPGRFSQVVKNRSHLNKLDAVIVVSTMQIDFFAGLVGRERVFYVPHGVDVDYFLPATDKPQPNDGLTCLFVGTHLRDFETLAGVARLLAQRGTNIRIVVLTAPDHHHHFSGLDNVSLHSGVGDDELREFYQQSDLFLLPVLDCTANNALLEALACGLPVVGTELQGLRDYVNPECARLTPPGDAAAMADAVQALAGNDAERRAMALASRERALEFRWEQVASQMETLYGRLANHSAAQNNT